VGHKCIECSDDCQHEFGNIVIVVMTLFVRCHAVMLWKLIIVFVCSGPGQLRCIMDVGVVIGLCMAIALVLVAGLFIVLALVAVGDGFLVVGSALYPGHSPVHSLRMDSLSNRGKCRLPAVSGLGNTVGFVSWVVVYIWCGSSDHMVIVWFAVVLLKVQNVLGPSFMVVYVQKLTRLLLFVASSILCLFGWLAHPICGPQVFGDCIVAQLLGPFSRGSDTFPPPGMTNQEFQVM